MPLASGNVGRSSGTITMRGCRPPLPSASNDIPGCQWVRLSCCLITVLPLSRRPIHARPSDTEPAGDFRRPDACLPIRMISAVLCRTIAPARVAAQRLGFWRRLPAGVPAWPRVRLVPSCSLRGTPEHSPSPILRGWCSAKQSTVRPTEQAMTVAMERDSDHCPQNQYPGHS